MLLSSSASFFFPVLTTGRRNGLRGEGISRADRERGERAGGADGIRRERAEELRRAGEARREGLLLVAEGAVLEAHRRELLLALQRQRALRRQGLQQVVALLLRVREHHVHLRTQRLEQVSDQNAELVQKT